MLRAPALASLDAAENDAGAASPDELRALAGAVRRLRVLDLSRNGLSPGARGARGGARGA